MRHMLRHFVAEFIGTFAIVFVVGLAVMMTRAMGAEAGSGLLLIATAYGATYAVFVSAFMSISGHFNPAVTFAFFAARRLDALMAGIYLCAQLLGAVLATYMLRVSVPIALFTATRGSGQSISLDITGTQAFMLEALMTFFLVFVIFGTAVDRAAPRIGGLAIGLTTLVATLAIYPLTGASLNPARSFGPAIVTGILEAQMIYWLAPIVGAVLAGVIYDQLFMSRSPEPVDHGTMSSGPSRS